MYILERSLESIQRGLHGRDILAILFWAVKQPLDSFDEFICAPIRS
ncbi:MAG: hypothetical protein L0287_10680 [Anaerolineae bacterium]|nr:hypothetical protein [Anaerolineae bacterium]